MQIIETFGHYVENLTEEERAEKQKKKALMQLLLSGVVRV